MVSALGTNATLNQLVVSQLYNGFKAWNNVTEQLEAEWDLLQWVHNAGVQAAITKVDMNKQATRTAHGRQPHVSRERRSSKVKRRRPVNI
jgi:hypothetical protein